VIIPTSDDERRPITPIPFGYGRGPGPRWGGYTGRTHYLERPLKVVCTLPIRSLDPGQRRHHRARPGHRQSLNPPNYGVHTIDTLVNLLFSDFDGFTMNRVGAILELFQERAAVRGNDARRVEIADVCRILS
jgi:hypothetical protein